MTVEAGRVTTTLGWGCGLGNLEARCHGDNRGPRSWRALVDEHVDLIVRSVERPKAVRSLPRDQALAQLYPRFIPSEPASLKAFGYGPASVPELLEVLALDLPESVDMLGADDLAELGDPAELREHALRNLRAVRIDRHEVVRGDDGSHFDVLMGESYFIPSLALVLDEVVGRYQDAASPHGVLVALPHRHQLAFHVVRDLSVVTSLHAMAQFARACFSTEPGAVSPSVYWWHEGRFVRVATQDGAGLPVKLTEEGTAVLGLVGG
ncbi:hypothetical protein ACFQ0T_41195 [Kitasatospora gansuensis]